LAMVLKGFWARTDLPSYWDENPDGANVGNNLNSLFQNDIINPSVSFQATYKTNATYGIDFQYLDFSISPNIVDSIDFGGLKVAFEKLHTSSWGLTAFYNFNTLNKPYYATTGFEGAVNFGLFYDRKFDIFFKSNTLGDLTESSLLNNYFYTNFFLKWVQPVNKKLSFISRVDMQMGNGNGDLEWFPYQTLVGGNRPIGWSVLDYEATPEKRFSNINYMAISIAFQLETINHLYLIGKVDYLESEYPMKWLYPNVSTQNFGAYPRRLGFSGKIAYNSIVGPLEIGLGKDQYIEGVHGFFGFGYYLTR